MNDEEFEKLFEESMQNVFGFNNDSINELANTAGSLRTLEEITKYMDEVLGKIDSFKISEAWVTLIENLPGEVISENFKGLLDKIGSYKKSTGWEEKYAISRFIERLPEEVKRENYEELCEFILDEEYSLELGSKLYTIYNLPLKLKKDENYLHILDLVDSGEVEPDKLSTVEAYRKMIRNNIIKSLSKEYISDNYEEVSKEFFVIQGMYTHEIKEFIAKVFSEGPNENDEKILEILKAQIEEYAQKNQISKTQIFSELPELLSAGFVKENIETLTEIFSLGDFKKLYPKIFEISENEVIDNEQMLKRLNLVSDFIKANTQYEWNATSEFRDIIKYLPRTFVEEYFEKCCVLFNKNNMADLCLRLFDVEENQEFDEEKTKRLLTFVKLTIDNNYDYENSFEKYDADRCWENLISKLPEEFIKQNPEYIVTLLDKKIPNKSREYFLQILPENIIRNYEEKLTSQVTDKNLSVYKRYIKYVVSNPEMSLITSSIGSAILNFINLHPNNTEPDFIEIRELFEKEKSKYERPDMNKYSDYLPENYSENLTLMDDSTFDGFINDLGIIKLFDGRIPEKYCDYVIKQKLTKDSLLNQNINKYLPMLKRVFEDKVHHILAKEGIEGYTIEFFEKDGSTLGYHNKSTRTIGFLEDNLLELDESNTHIINTAYHEVRHAIQAKYYNSTDFTKLDGSRYNMIKEEIIRDDENYFYNRNYTRMYCEIDARVAGTRGQAEYLKYLGVPEERVIENVGSTQKTLKEIVEINQKEEQGNTEYASNKVDRDGRIVSISQKASELIKKKPDWLKKYPVLGLEFDENGERKKTLEILSNAISCNDDSVRDIYIKMFETSITVSLEDAAETLEYISKLLETRNGYDDDIVDFVSLIVKNETFESLRDADINDIECRRVLSLLNTISTDNPNLEISEYIKEMLDTFSRDGKINIETKKDNEISDSAISTMLQRNIKSREEFERLLKDLPKVMIDKENKNYKLGYGFGNVFKKYFKNDPTIDFNELLKVVLENVSDANRDDIIEYSWSAVPDELKIKHMQGFVELSSKYRAIDLEFAYKTFSKISREDMEKNPNLAENVFGKYLEPEVFPAFKIPKSKAELETVIEELKNNGVENDYIEKLIELAIKNETQKGNVESIEMLYTQLDFLDKDYKKSSAISGFFIGADKKLQKENIIQILRYTLMEKVHFSEEDVKSTIRLVKSFASYEIFEENPDLVSAIDEIEKDALERAKTKPEISKEEPFIITLQDKKIQTIDEFEEKLQALREANTEDWDLVWELCLLFRDNFDKDSELDFNLMLDMSLNLLTNENRKNNMIEYFWRDMPDEMRLENINNFVAVSSKYRSIDLPFVYEIMSKFDNCDMEINPNLAEEIFGEYFPQSDIPFLRMPKNKAELESSIKDAQNKGGEDKDIKNAIGVIVQKESAKGNHGSIEILYEQLEFLKEEYDRSHAMTVFFIYADKTLVQENAEKILRHVLIEKNYFSEEGMANNVIENAKRFIGNKILEENPDLLLSIDEIQREASEKTKQGSQEIKVEDISVDSIDGIPSEIISEGDTEKEEILALQEISESVPANEISTGTNMIKFFLSKAKEVKRKIGRFFGGGDDHDNR